MKLILFPFIFYLLTHLVIVQAKPAAPPEVDRLKMQRQKNEKILENNNMMLKDLTKVGSRLGSVKNELSLLESEYLPVMDKIITKMYMEISAGKPLKGATLKAKPLRGPRIKQELTDQDMVLMDDENGNPIQQSPAFDQENAQLMADEMELQNRPKNLGQGPNGPPVNFFGMSASNEHKEGPQFIQGAFLQNGVAGQFQGGMNQNGQNQMNIQNGGMSNNNQQEFNQQQGNQRGYNRVLTQIKMDEKQDECLNKQEPIIKKKELLIPEIQKNLNNETLKSTLNKSKVFKANKTVKNKLKKRNLAKKPAINASIKNKKIQKKLKRQIKMV